MITFIDLYKSTIQKSYFKSNLNCKVGIKFETKHKHSSLGKSTF